MAALGGQELLELLLLRGDGAGGAGGSTSVHDKPSLTMTDLHNPPPPSSPALPTYYSAAGGNRPFGKSAPPSEAEMVSWLGQVFFEQEPRGAATVTETTTKSERLKALLPSSSAGVAASSAAECRRGRTGSGQPSSCSGKAAEQRRRAKINDKLRTLQQMMPSWCSKGKTDKASTLDQIIQYVKSLQHQVQVMSANGYAAPTPIWPLGVMPPPPCMQLPAGEHHVLGGLQAPVMLPQCPVFQTVYARSPHHGTPPPQTSPDTRRHPAVETDAAGGRQLPLLAPRPSPGPLVPNDLSMPIRR